MDVRAWAWVGDDIALTDAARRVRLWTDGALQMVGRTGPIAPDDVELVADGTQVGWVDSERGFTVYDFSTSEATSAMTDRGNREPAKVTARDEGTLYGTDARGTVAFTLGTYAVDVLPGDLGAVIDVEGGTLLRAAPGRKARVVGPGRDLTLTTDSFANLAPDGAHVVAESNDEGILLDTATGQRIGLDTGYDWALPFQWLDDDAVAVLALSGEDPFLVSCSVSSGACASAETLSMPVQLPVGIHFTE